MQVKRLYVVIAVVLLVAGGLWYGLTHFRESSTVSKPNAAAVQARTVGQLDRIVAAYRKIIVLVAEEASLDPMNRERVSLAGKILFQQNQEHIAALSEALTGELAGTAFPALEALLGHVENSPEYHDADKLAFREVFEDLAAGLASRSSGATLQKRVKEDLAALDQIQALYEKEIALTAGRFQTRAMAVRREAWDRYLAYIQQKYQREQILKEMEAELPVAESRGGGRKKSSRNEIFGSELPPKTLVLTFDDGPHPRYTDQILEILKKYHLQAVFFEVGHNLGTVGRNDEIKLTPTAAASYRILAAGSSLANHTYSHALLPKLDEPGYSQEIESTDKILKFILKANPALFRPPYGASNDQILSAVEARQLKSIMWNIDSLDWADPVPKSITQRILSEIEHEGRGIILFHDIHKRAIEVLPSLIETLLADGYRFAAWNGSSFSVNETRGTQTAAAPTPAESPYRESWAAIVGIDNYANWPKLRYAANDAQGIRDLLIQKYNFKPQNVFLLLNQEATRQNILSLLGDKLANPEMVKHEDRVFVFFAGHGATRTLPSGRDLGYIIPVDADVSNYQGQSISMTNFQDIAESIPAKHVLFVMDSCYSGLALTRGGAVPASQNYLREISRREARQMFTAGGADQQVADNGPNGHSVFTWTLLQGLDGRGDMNGDGVITATELAAYVAPAVSSLSRQTPAFGNMPGSEGGDFVFDLKHESEFLSSASSQLGEDAIRLNTEVERLRSENQEIREELAAAQAQLEQKKPQATRAVTPAERALALNDEGFRLYKEKKYAEAAAKFSEAAGLDPRSALLANNAGFAMYKLEKYDEALRWIERAIALNPNRAVAYVNLGDVCLNLKREAQARKAFEKYLQLAPAGKSAAYVKEKLKDLAP